MSTIEELSKAFSKLIEVCANGIGIIYEPRHLVKMAEAYKKAQNILGSSNMQLTYNDGKISLNPTQLDQTTQLVKTVDSIHEDSLNRINYQREVHQRNIENVIGFAVDHLKNDEEISEEPVDRSWSDTFFNDAAHIFDQDLQLLWGKILAGEIAEPGKYSSKTLSILRTLSKKDAELFEKFSSTVFNTGELFFILSDRNLIIQNKSNLIEKEDLVSLGLLTSDGLTWTLFENERTPKIYEFGQYAIFLQPKPEAKKFNLGFYCLSQTGRELMSILPDRNFQYLQALSDYFKAKGIILEYSKINYVRDGIINYSLPKKTF